MENGQGFAAPDPLKDIHNYSEGMTISQVVRFFERREMPFTKTMIQNYVRIGLLPPPAEKRLYGRGHLTMLTMIHSLKTVFSLEEIGALFAMAGGGSGEAGRMAAVYGDFLAMSAAAAEKIQTLEIQTPETDGKDEKYEKYSKALLYMAAATLIKKTAQALLQQNS